MKTDILKTQAQPRHSRCSENADTISFRRNHFSAKVALTMLWLVVVPMVTTVTTSTPVMAEGSATSSEVYNKPPGVPVTVEQILQDGQYAIDNHINKHYRFSERFGTYIEFYILHKKIDGKYRTFIFNQRYNYKNTKEGKMERFRAGDFERLVKSRVRPFPKVEEIKS